MFALYSNSVYAMHSIYIIVCNLMKIISFGLKKYDYSKERKCIYLVVRQIPNTERIYSVTYSAKVCK